MSSFAAMTGLTNSGRAAQAEYIFKHALTHAVAYESLLLARRKELHRHAAEAIEQSCQGEITEHAPILGAHYAKADLPAKAVPYLTQAGERAASSYANQEAIAFYKQAIEQLARAPASQTYSISMPELQERIGDLLQLIVENSEARQSYGAALELINKDAGTRAIRNHKARLHRKIAKSYEIQREFAEAFRSYAEAERILGDESEFDSSAWKELIEIGLERAWSQYFRNDLADLAGELERLKKAVEVHASPRQRAELAHRVVLMHFRQERFDASDETVALAREALRLRKSAGNLLQIGHGYFNLGLIHTCRLELAEAAENLAHAQAIAERTGDLTLLSRCLTYAVLIQRRRQDSDAAELALKRLIPVATRGAMTEYLAMAKATLAWIAWRKGNKERARAEAESAMEIWSAESVYPFKWNALWVLMALAAHDGDNASVIKYARGLLDPSQQPLSPDLASSLAKLTTTQGHKALEIAQQAVELAHRHKYL